MNKYCFKQYVISINNISCLEDDSSNWGLQLNLCISADHMVSVRSVIANDFALNSNTNMMQWEMDCSN